MIPLPEFVSLLRQRLDVAIDATEQSVLQGAIIDHGSPAATAMHYVGAANRVQGLRDARALIDDIVKQINAGDL